LGVERLPFQLEIGRMQEDPWKSLRRRTTARVALGRAGGSLPTGQVLSFAADHADARDAVYSQLDLPALQASLGDPIVLLHSQASDRQTYLQRPDLGRRLDAESAAKLQSITAEQVDIVLIVADGLSATAAQHHAAVVTKPLLVLLREKRLTVAPLCVVQQARVAIEDEIGSLLRAKLAVILIGERPGLGTADSLGAYLIHDPGIGKTDADRNCVSNIHPRHLPPERAADTLSWLIEQSIIRKISGVGLKDDRPRLLGAV
jgi:ethanolamine ammonia-lyase small subunit